LLSLHARALLEQVIAEMAQMRDRPAPGRPVRLFRQTLRMDAAQTAAARMNVAVRGAVQRPLRRCGQGSRRAPASVRIRRADTLSDVRAQTSGGHLATPKSIS